MILSTSRGRFAHLSKKKAILFLVAGLLFQRGADSMSASAQQTEHRFTVADEVRLAHFGDPYGGHAEAVHFSPNGKYFAVHIERARLDLKHPEDTLRFYRSRDVKDFLKHSDGTLSPSPVWIVKRSTGSEGPIISDWRWLRDSSGVAFLERMADGSQRLAVGDLRKRTVEPLTYPLESVGGFDISDRSHYVYTVADPAEKEKQKAEREAAAIVGTGRSLFELIFPTDLRSARNAPSTRYFWAVIGSKRFKVKKDGGPLASFGSFALSPDGQSLVTTLPVVDVPSAWETLYPPPPYTPSTHRIHAGHYDAKSSHVHQYVRVDLQTGSIHSLTDAPLSDDAGWTAIGDPSWSDDGNEILLPNTFVKSNENAPSRPCVAVIDVSSGGSTCVEALKAHKTETIMEQGYHLVWGARFVGRGTGLVMVAYISHEDETFRTIEYQHTHQNAWQAVREIKGAFPAEHEGLEVSIKQGLNDPPVLVAEDQQVSRVIWDPNPQLKNIELGEASVYTWKDKEGRDWKAGLYKPSNYKAGQRYPLVIQTHGFDESFRPSGAFPTAFAARALAAAGMVVLQLEEHCPILTPSEGPCAVADYESAANQLVVEGLVDPDEIGIIGFSRSCFYVMEALTTGSFHIKAASITDGVMEDYPQYINSEGGENRLANEANLIVGAPPFGEGLQQWLKRSPGFNLTKVTAPLLVVGEGPRSLLFMWEPYAGLHFLHKPVDLVMLNTAEHVLTNPAVRLVSQGGSVDWFRFWLKGEEDPDPSKADQYVRWRELRKLQEANEDISATPQADSN
jgi:dipeptidyl aminopeptidase/acylaminoacyl peptidase